MSREERRRPEKRKDPPKTPQQDARKDIEARTKSHRHKKVTADKWNQ